MGLFEGEIKVSEKEADKGILGILRIRKLHNQRYLENKLTLIRKKLESQEREIGRLDLKIANFLLKFKWVQSQYKLASGFILLKNVRKKSSLAH